MKNLVAILLLLGFSSCEDRLYKERYDVEFFITNKTSHVISELTIDGAYGAKVWVIKNIDPEKTEKLRFNIKRDLKISEGGFIISAILTSSDTLRLNTGYFTNWGYQAPNPSNFAVYDDRIELEK